MAKTSKKGDEATLDNLASGLPGKPGKPGCPVKPGQPGCPGLALATAYVPPQAFANTYSLPDALQHGTLFPELYRPYTPKGCPAG